MQVQSLGQKDPLEKGSATHFTTLAGESRGQGSVADCSLQGCTGLDTTEVVQQASTYYRGQWASQTFPAAPVVTGQEAHSLVFLLSLKF